METHILTVLWFCGYICTADASVFRRQIPGSNFSLSLEWSDTPRQLTDADYLLQRSAAADDANDAGGRPGHSTTTHSCDHIRGVPSQLRSSTYMHPSGLSTFYQKYTEAYGIPVLSSNNVPDDALRRACYVLRFMLADHSGVRQSFYSFSGRVAVIGAQEGTVSIPEHAFLGASWNDRARGLGATESAPVSSGGEENMLCYTNDRYHDEDIFLHEFSHGVHLLGAKYAIPGWQSRLQSLYNQAKSSGRWSNTYAMSTKEEYFAEGTQSFFDVNAYASPPNGIHNEINTPEKLRGYDPQLYSLIQEVFPCSNTYIKRCKTTRDQELKQSLRMDCNVGGSVHQGTASSSVTQSPVTQAPITGTCTDNNVNCASWASRGECNNNPSYMHGDCKRSCNLCSGTGGTCKDDNANCASWASQGECNNNPGYMHVDCKRSCNLCSGTGGGKCEDSNSSCGYWAGNGECTKNAPYMKTSCRKSCNLC